MIFHENRLLADIANFAAVMIGALRANHVQGNGTISTIIEEGYIRIIPSPDGY